MAQSPYAGGGGRQWAASPVERFQLLQYSSSPGACLVPQDTNFSTPPTVDKLRSNSMKHFFRFRIAFLPAYSTSSQSLDMKYTFFQYPSSGRMCISTQMIHRWWVEQKKNKRVTWSLCALCLNVCEARWLEWLLTICPLRNDSRRTQLLIGLFIVLYPRCLGLASDYTTWHMPSTSPPQFRNRATSATSSSPFSVIVSEWRLRTFYSYGGETLTQAILSQVPDPFSLQKFFIHREFQLFSQSLVYLKPFTFCLLHDLSFIFHFFHPSWCDKNHNLCDHFNLSQNYLMNLFFFQLHLSNTPLPAISVIFGRMLNRW